MLKDIKLPFNSSLLEIASITSFLAIGYAFIYKLGFYLSMDILWFFYELPPINIAMGSIIFFIIFIFSIFLGYLFVSALNKISHPMLRICIEIIFLISFLVGFIYTIPLFALFTDKYKFYNYNFPFFNVVLVYFFVSYSIFSSIQGGFYTDDVEKDKGFGLTKSRITIISIILICYPFLYGALEGSALINNKEKVLREVKIKDNNKWYLVNYYDDKFLILSGGKENLFKIVEYKDIESINAKPAGFQKLYVK